MGRDIHDINICLYDYIFEILAIFLTSDVLSSGFIYSLGEFFGHVLFDITIHSTSSGDFRFPSEKGVRLENVSA